MCTPKGNTQAEETKMNEKTTKQIEEMMNQTMRYSVIIVSTVPVLCAYPFIQKYFTKGVMVGAVKG